MHLCFTASSELCIPFPGVAFDLDVQAWPQQCRQHCGSCGILLLLVQSPTDELETLTAVDHLRPLRTASVDDARPRLMARDAESRTAECPRPCKTADCTPAEADTRSSVGDGTSAATVTAVRGKSQSFR